MAVQVTLAVRSFVDWSPYTPVAVSGIVRSQIPGHNPVNENLPALANEWFNRYDAGYDVTRWYTAADQQPA